MNGEYVELGYDYYPICNETTECFAQCVQMWKRRCTLLTKTYPKNECPFKKVRKQYTKNKYYPYTYITRKR